MAIDEANRSVIRYWIKKKRWDGILLGNIDLLGPELLPTILGAQCVVQHHIGFVHAPFPINSWPNSDLYRLVAASDAVRTALVEAGLPVSKSNVVYPGVRTEMFEKKQVGMPTPLYPDGSGQKPLKVCFAGLLMGSKGAHTLVEAIIQLLNEGLKIQATFAGDNFQEGYREQLEEFLKQKNHEGAVQFVGQLKRQALARFYALHHVGVFPSIHPEAFGIVAAEMMASGLAVVSSGMGGAGELIDDGLTGLKFKAGDSEDLASCLRRLAEDNCLLQAIRKSGQKKAKNDFAC